MRDPLACDDPIAERRYNYARAASEDGDWVAAAEVLEQALERAPRWAPAWFGLGEARERLGDKAGAAMAFRAALAADPSDAMGARGRLSLFGEDSIPDALPRAYVARLFDDYAARFDAHLRNELGYRGPEVIAAALDRVDPARRFSRCLDLGCGTGLAGAALRGRVDALIGVDLSPRMIARAGDTGLYDALEVADAVEFLSSPAARGADLVVAADALVYFGDLGAVFEAVSRAIAPSGLFAFSVETCGGEGYRLGRGMRFAHSERHVREAASRARLRRLMLADGAVRREAGIETPGMVGVFARGFDDPGSSPSLRPAASSGDARK